MEKRKRPLFEEDNEAQKQQHEQRAGGSRARAKLKRKSAQSARTTAKKANVGNARDQARASIAES